MTKFLKIKRLWFLLLVPIAFFINYLSSLNPLITETVFSRGIYKYYSSFFSMITGFVPFSLGEMLLVLSLVVVALLLIISVARSIQTKKLKPILNYILNILMSASVLYFIFVFNCGINYNRLSFEHYYGEFESDFSVEELAFMCETLIVEAGEIRESLDFERLNFNSSLVQKIELADIAGAEMDKLAETYTVLSGEYGNAKPVFFSNLLSEIRITGVFFPWTFEANINGSVPFYQIPFTMLHEEVHQRGFMREDEANFIAWLAGKDAENLTVKYSCYMAAINYSMNSLYSADPDSYWMVYEKFTDDQRYDRQISSDYWKQYESQAAEIWTEVNDNYLKANGQEDGVISYSKVTQLILTDFYK